MCVNRSLKLAPASVVTPYQYTMIIWAVIFGYAQQLVTGLIDQRAHGVLEEVGGRGASGERPPTPD